MPSIASRIRQLEARATEGESGLLLQPWSMLPDGRATTILQDQDQEHTQTAEETVEEFHRRVAGSMIRRRPVVWFSEQEAAL